MLDNGYLGGVGAEVKGAAGAQARGVGVPVKQPAVLAAAEDVVRVDRVKLHVPNVLRVRLLHGARVFRLRASKKKKKERKKEKGEKEEKNTPVGYENQI